MPSVHIVNTINKDDLLVSLVPNINCVIIGLIHFGIKVTLFRSAGLRQRLAIFAETLTQLTADLRFEVSDLITPIFFIDY
jgi:hypothetical protein